MLLLRSVLMRFAMGLLLVDVAGGQVEMAAPAVDINPGIPASITPDDYASLAGRQVVTVSDFALPDGRNVTLDLRAVRVFAPHAELVLVTDEGPRPMPRPELAVLSGTIAGESSRVVLTITPDAAHGIVRTADGDYFLSSGPPQAGLPTIIFDPRDVPAEWLARDPFTCHFDDLAGQPAVAAEAPAGGLRTLPCRIAEVALETDWEFRQLFVDDASASAYAAALLAADSEIFTTDVNLTLEIAYLRIWSTSADPWVVGGSLNARLIELRDYWNLNMTGVTRHVVHMFSGVANDAGVAYGDAACMADFDYAVSSGLDGSFPYPLADNDAGNWDVYITAHEFGHSFGNPHTHAIGIDDCANGDCSVAPNGTLMSYCDRCPGGMTNIVLNFHPTMIAAETLPFLSGGQCSLDANAPVVIDEPNSVSLCGGDDLLLSVAWTAGGSTSAQWRKDGIDIPGANDPNFAIPAATPGDSGDYDVVITNACGSTTSVIASVLICGGSMADLDGDCDVDLSDLATLLANFGQTGAARSDGDINGDTDVNLTDLAEMLAEFGIGC